MPHKKHRALLAAALALLHLLLFALHFSTASLIESDVAVQIVGYVIDLALAVALALAGGILLCDLTRAQRTERYLLPALPFLARLFYYAPYHTLDFTLSDSMTTASAIPSAILLALLESGVWYGAFLLTYLVYRRITGNAPQDETAALLTVSLPLVRTLIAILVSLIASLIHASTLLWSGVLLGYLLELALSLIAAVLSYYALRYLQSKL